jgi:hypothetical protein
MPAEALDCDCSLSRAVATAIERPQVKLDGQRPPTELEAVGKP